MAGICNTCKHFRGSVNPGSDKPHQCALQNVSLSANDAGKNCPECVQTKK